LKWEFTGQLATTVRNHIDFSSTSCNS